MMTFFITYEQGIAKATIQDEKIVVKPHFSLSGATYLDAYNQSLFTISANGIAVYDKEHLLFEDTQFVNKPSHITYIHEQKLIVTSNYHDGLLSLYRFDKPNVSFLETIKYPVGSRIHQAYYDETHKRLWVVNLGLDCLYVYHMNNNHLALLKTIELPKKTGPRHLCISKTGFVFVVTEYSHEIYVYDQDFNFIHVYPTLMHAHNKSDASAIRLSYDQTLLMVLNRGEDYITTFKVLGHTLELVGVYETKGLHARDFNYSLDDLYVLVANKHSNNLTLFKNDGGQLTYVSQTSIDAPTMVLNSINT